MTSPEIELLQDQQALLTRAMSSMLQGMWCGEPPSVQAFTQALDPNLTVDCTSPVLQSDGPLEPPEFLGDYDPNTTMPPQVYNWTCSACALDWIKRAARIDPHSTRERTVEQIGYPEHINPTYGLMDGSGSQLRRVLSDTYGQYSEQGWLSYDSAWALYSQVPGMLSGAAWYHWVAVRGTSDGTLWIANSAPGYMGVWDVLTREDFQRLGGMSCVWLIP